MKQDRPITIVGDIVRYEPGHVIVLRDSANKEVSYTLTPSVTIPTGVEVGRRVTLYTTRGTDGSSTVTRVSTSVTPEGNVQRTVENLLGEADFYVFAIGDFKDEGDRSVTATILPYPGYGPTSQGSATVWIVDAPVVSIKANVSQVYENAAPGTAMAR